jgi:tetratricopeptide (TPR) repeat protein
MREFPRKQRDFLSHKQRRRRRFVFIGTALVLTLVFFLGILPAIRDGSVRHASPDDLILKDYSPSKILSLWKANDYPGILRFTSVYLKKHPLDSFALTFDGFAAFYNGLNQPKDEDMLPFIDEAVVSLRKALLTGHNPLIRDLYYVLGKAYYHKGHFYMDSAILYLDAALRSGYGPGDAYEYLGLAYSQLTRYDKSVEVFLKAMKTNHSDALYMTVAQSYIHMNDFPDAENYLTQAINSTRDVTVEEKSRFLLGDIYVKQKAYQKAIDQYTSILTKNTDSADAYYNLGLLYQEMGDTVRARAEWRKAIRLEPTHAGARLHLKS